MSEVCLICLGPTKEPGAEYHPKCLQRLFGTRRLPKIEVDPNELHMLGIRMAGRLALSGVQRKIGVGWTSPDRKTLRVLAGGSHFILKPPSRTFVDLPQNEHLCMRLARALEIPAADTGLARLTGGDLALIIRRFDRTDEGAKLPMEDFCQLAPKAPARKYQGSIELCAKLLRRFSDAPPLDLRQLFRQVLFSWWVGNGDLHLKNLSLLSKKPNEPRLSPAYDLVSTRLCFPRVSFEMALPQGGKQRKLRAGDWLRLAEFCGLSARVVRSETERFLDRLPELLRLTLAAPLAAKGQSSLLTRLLGEAAMLEQLRDRATRRARLKRSPTPLFSSASLEQVAHEARVALEEAGVDSARGPLDAQIKDQVRSFRSLEESGQALAVADLSVLPRLATIARTIPIAARLDGFAKRIAPHLGNLGVRPTGEGRSAEDRYFECEVAARLTADHWQIAFGETDVILTDGEGTDFGFECKRVGSLTRARKHIAKGQRQLEREGLQGVVVMELLEIDGCRSPFKGVLEKGAARPAFEGLLRSTLEAQDLDHIQAIAPESTHQEPRSGVHRGIAGGPSLLGVLFCLRCLAGLRHPDGSLELNEFLVWHAVTSSEHETLSPWVEALAHQLRIGLPN